MGRSAPRLDGGGGSDHEENPLPLTKRVRAGDRASHDIVKRHKIHGETWREIRGSTLTIGGGLPKEVARRRLREEMHFTQGAFHNLNCTGNCREKKNLGVKLARRLKET